MIVAAPLSRPAALLVDDDGGMRISLRAVLEAEEVDVDEAETGEEALTCLRGKPYHVVITDLRMPGLTGLDLLRRITAEPLAPPVIVVTGHGSELRAVEAMKLGAFDYFRKPFDPGSMTESVRRALESVRLVAENERLAGELSMASSFVFRSDAMRKLAIMVGRVAPRDVTVLISGESGTGKERIAEAIVRASPRATKQFVRFNCAALAPSLAEAELFGHSRGAFTDAHRSRRGLFREADGGTLLLDEIGELDLGLQAKLLRVLQSGEVRPIGEDKTVCVDVRIVAVSNQDVGALVQQGRFREDLFYRLRVVHLRVPPLRERPEDVPALARHFLDLYTDRFGTGALRVPPELLDRLREHSWPGNVRELQHVVENLVALSHEGQVDLTLLPARSRHEDESRAEGPRATLRQKISAYERGLVVAALREAHGNRSEAARLLGISRAALHDKLVKYGLRDGESAT